jgi:hypothetical protein
MAALVAPNATPPYKVPKFLRSLYAILQTEDQSIITWVQNQQLKPNRVTAFHILDMPRFEKEILPKYFKHRKFASFQRQLNNFGFRKWTKTQSSGVCTFSHNCFPPDPNHVGVMRASIREHWRQKSSPLSRRKVSAAEVQQVKQQSSILTQQQHSLLKKEPHTSPTPTRTLPSIINNNKSSSFQLKKTRTLQELNDGSSTSTSSSTSSSNSTNLHEKPTTTLELFSFKNALKSGESHHYLFHHHHQQQQQQHQQNDSCYFGGGSLLHHPNSHDLLLKSFDFHDIRGGVGNACDADALLEPWAWGANFTAGLDFGFPLDMDFEKEVPTNATGGGACHHDRAIPSSVEEIGLENFLFVE